MRAQIIGAMVLVASGCGLVSGLDDLGVSDGASADATSEMQLLDASSLIDVTPQVDGNASVRCGATQNCVGGMVCCAAPNGNANPFSCAATCPADDITLACDDQIDCPPQSVCCFSGKVATCQATDQPCPMTLCAPEQGVPCSKDKCLPFDAGAGLNLDKCN